MAVAPPGRLGAVGYAEPSLMFLAGTGTEFLSPAGGAQALAARQVSSLLVGARELPSVLGDLRRLGTQPGQVAVVRGFNYSRGRFATLTLLVPER